MNNSFLAIESVSLSMDEPVSRTEHFQERENELIRIIGALRDVKETTAWSTLKEKVFDSLVANLEKELATEAKKDNPDALKLNRLAGQLKWAEKYADLDKLADVFRKDLTNIRQKLHGTT